MRRFGFWVVAGGFLAVLVSGCLALPATEAPPLPAATPTPTATATATEAWFPPTSTPTPLPPTPIPTPTPDLQAGVGQVLLSAPFARPAGWFSPHGAAGRFGVADGVLALTVTRPRGTLVVLQQQVTASNLYLSVEAEPQVCRSEDAYGVVVRATSGAGRYYRFGLTCQGEAFLESVEGGLPVPQVTPQPGGVPAGVPIRAVLSVRAAGKTLDFAVNGQVLFSVQDRLPLYGRGYFGFFARAAGNEGVIVAFRNLTLRALP